MTFPQLVIVCTGGFAVLFVLGWCAHYWRDQRREWPLTFEDQATADTFASMERPPELHHEAPQLPSAPALATLTERLDAVPPSPYRPRHGPTEPTAVWPRPPRQPIPPILPPACGPAVAVLGALSRDIRDRIDFPHLTRPWADDTGTFAAIAKAGE